jgi:hypothetical protein
MSKPDTRRFIHPGPIGTKRVTTGRRRKDLERLPISFLLPRTLAREAQLGFQERGQFGPGNSAQPLRAALFVLLRMARIGRILVNSAVRELDPYGGDLFTWRCFSFLSCLTVMTSAQSQGGNAAPSIQHASPGPGRIALGARVRSCPCLAHTLRAVASSATPSLRGP